AQMSLVRRPEDEARVPVAARDENRVPRLGIIVAGGEGASCALTVDVDPTELRMMLALDQVVADFVDKRQRPAEDLLEGQRDLLEHGQAVDDGEVSARRHRVEIVSIVRRLRREVAKVERLDGRVLFFRQTEIVRRQPMAEAAATGVHLHIERVSTQVSLELDEVVAAAQCAELGDAALRTTLPAPWWLPRVVDGKTVTLRPRPVDTLPVLVRVVGGPAADDRLELLLREGLEPRLAD